jgi:tetratricopeptide (TPR) repeat protein
VPPHARRARAMLMALAARVASRQGRAEQAVRWTDRAESVLGPHPALARLRGRAHARVWRWEQAADAFGVAAAGAPRDDKLWRWLARARGSAGDNRPALLAARRGLQLTPRDPGLLRSQSLALRELSSPHHPEARQAFVEHRSPDKLPALRSRCGRTQPPCQRDRQPIPTVRLRPR